MPTTGRYNHFICDTIAERDALLDSPFLEINGPEGIYVFVKYPDFTDESDGLVGSDEEAILNGKLYIYTKGAFQLSSPEVPPALDDKVDKVVGKGLSENDFTNAHKDKVDFISVTQPVDLDAIESRVNDLDAAVVLKGTFTPSGGSFPGGGIAQAGWSYIATDDGTIDGYVIKTGDRVIAVTDNASTSVATNWFHADYTDQFLSLDGQVGVVTLNDLINAKASKTTPVDADTLVITDSAASNALKRVTWANIKATLLSYFNTVYSALGHAHTPSDVTGFNAAALAAAPAETTSTLGATINGSSAATPNDTDLVATVESSVVKKITWTNVKAFLKTYFDTVYTTAGAVVTYVGTQLSSYLTTAAAALTYQPIATGTPDGTKFLRDDNSWQSVPASDLDSTISSSSTISANKNRVIGTRYILDARLILDGKLTLI